MNPDQDYWWLLLISLAVGPNQGHRDRVLIGKLSLTLRAAQWCLQLCWFCWKTEQRETRRVVWCWKTLLPLWWYHVPVCCIQYCGCSTWVVFACRGSTCSSVCRRRRPCREPDRTRASLVFTIIPSDKMLMSSYGALCHVVWRPGRSWKTPRVWDKLYRGSQPKTTGALLKPQHGDRSADTAEY